MHFPTCDDLLAENLEEWPTCDELLSEDLAIANGIRETRERRRNYVALYQRRYRQLRGSEVNTQQREYRQGRRDIINAQQREYRQERRENINTQQREYRQERRDVVNTEQREYRKKNAEALNEARRAVKMKKKQDFMRWLETEAKLNAFTKEKKDEMRKNLKVQLGPVGLDEGVCAVCDCICLRSNLNTIKEESTEYATVIKAMQRKLKVPKNVQLPERLLGFYDVSMVCFQLKNVLLSKDAVFVSKNGVISINICTRCYTPLLKSKNDLPPKFAIANHLWIGKLPKFLMDATWTEKLMTLQVSVIAHTRVLTGGKHRSIQSHSMIFDAVPGPPVTQLPRTLNDNEVYNIVLAGSFTPAQKQRIIKEHCVRHYFVIHLLQFYLKHNPAYRDIQLNMDELETLLNEEIPENILQSVEITSEDNRDLDAEHDLIRDGKATHRTSEEETVIVESTSMYKETQARLSKKEESDIIQEQVEGKETYKVHHSSQFAAGHSTVLKMFAHLLPYGREHPEEKRRVPISEEIWTRHVLQLSSRVFARDEYFTLVMFDRISMKKAFQNTQISINMNPNDTSLIGQDLTVDEVQEIFNCERNQRRGLEISGAQKLINNAKLSANKVWGSNEERKRHEKQIMALTTRYGQPHVFATITPDVEDTICMAYYAGELDINSLFEADFNDLPNGAKMKHISMRDGCASARLFDRMMKTFILEVVGFDDSTKLPRKEGGMFGHCRAYFGMPETQGSGTLHLHCLLWLYGGPRTTTIYEERIQNDTNYASQMRTYVDSIITTNNPIPTDAVTCSECGCIGMFKAESLSCQMRRSVFKRNREGFVPKEPILARCTNCGQGVSSQNLLRLKLCQNRPSLANVILPTTSIDIALRARHCQKTEEEMANYEAVKCMNEEYKKLTPIEANDQEEIDIAWHRQAYDTLQNPNKLITRTKDPFYADENLRALRAMPYATDITSYQRMQLLFYFNTHWWQHMPSCFKNSNFCGPKTCRYAFPQPRVAETSVSMSGIKIQRLLGDEYNNAYSDVILESFKCNHDIKFLIGGYDMAEKAYYMCKYTSKPQKNVQNRIAVLVESFKKRLIRETSEDDVIKKARGRINSMAYSMTKKVEVATSLASLYLLRGRVSYCSNDFSSISLYKIIRTLGLKKDAHECTLVPISSSGMFKNVSSLEDYVYRPKHLENTSLYFFACDYFRRQESDVTNPKQLFLEAHSLRDTHVCGKHHNSKVPVIFGPNIPNIESSRLDEANLTLHAQITLILFQPFRSLEDLTGNDTWVDAYERWVPSRPKEVENILENMYNIDEARKRGKINRKQNDTTKDLVDYASDEEETIEGYLQVESAEYCTDTWNESSDETHFVDGVVPSVSNLDPAIFGSTKYYENNASSDLIEDFGLFNATARRIQKNMKTIERSKQGRTQHNNFSPFANKPIAIPIATPQLLKQLKKWNKEAPVIHENKLDHWKEVPRDMKVNLIGKAFTDCKWTSGSCTYDISENYPSIAEISNAYTLNFLQHISFMVLAKSVLKMWELRSNLNASSLDDNQYADELQQVQTFMYLGGEGGTGKTRVVNAFVKFCELWNHPKAICKTATTGKAAGLIGGITIHSFLGQFGVFAQTNIETTVARGYERDMCFLVIDEVSMLTAGNLQTISEILKNTTKIDLPFGGISIALVGDFFQLPPCKGLPLYTAPRSSSSTESVAGFKLWSELFNNVVILEETKRFEKDPEYGEMVSKARLGIWTDEFIDLLRTRTIFGASNISLGKQHKSWMDNLLKTIHEDASNTVFVSPSNETKTKLSRLATQAIFSDCECEPYPVRIMGKFGKQLQALSKQDVKMIMQQPESRFQRLPTFMDVCPGMPVMLTKNVNCSKRMSNGSFGTLLHIVYDEGNMFQRIWDDQMNIFVSVPTKQILFVLLKLDDFDSKHQPPPGFEEYPGIIPLFPTTGTATINLTPDQYGMPRTRSLTMTQFPMVPRISSTAYKVQGETLTSLVIESWKDILIPRSNRPEQAYLMLSRVTSRKDLVILEPITKRITDWSKPSENCLIENERLKQLHQTTIARYA